MDEQHEVTLGGTRHRVTRRLIENRLADREPERIRKYFVEIGDRRFPVKQVIAVGLGVSRAGFQSQEAYRILRTLGFEPREESLED
jgi:hypothetical protein